MEPLNFIVKIAIYALMLGSVIAAIGVVTLRNLFYAALALVGVLLGTAGIYIVLHAEFLAAVQVLLYVGSVITLVIFVIMLTQRLTDKSLPQTNRQSLIALAGSLAFLYFLTKTILHTPWPVNPAITQVHVSTADLGSALMGNFVFPFEVISVILLAVLIGAIVIAKKDKES
ncbi:MAG: NADH-quinone oxidoreductase subunit J [Candidatus Omnitrophica bacterium]|nr:NADH-quinone oxidoreductase subunit J [Candidatus Omnitrophota bacterium]